MTIRQRTYHRDGTTCADAGSCGEGEHTRVPPRCGAGPRSYPGGPDAARPVACVLPAGHPGSHLDLGTGCEYPG
jgi:hypothetical protein